MPKATSQSTKQEIHDLASRAAVIHRVEMIFHPESWSSIPSNSFAPNWTQISFPPEGCERASIPKNCGVYVFIVKSNIFNFPFVSGIFYVGMATSLYTRISSYIGEINKPFLKSKRPSVWKMINFWNGHLQYFYTETPDKATALALEDAMINAIRPPFNADYSATLSPAMRAFR